MLDVVFTFCLLAKPTECQTLRAKTELEDTQFVQCVIKAEETLAKYITEDMFLKEFGCRRRDSKDS